MRTMQGLFKTLLLRRGRGLASIFLLLALAAAGLTFPHGRGLAAQSQDSRAAQVFRQGRDLIESEDWPAASAKFEGYVAQYPKSKETDAALYWLAYALKKQSKFEVAQRTLERLVREFPRSSWADDARAMEVEIAPQVGRRVDPEGLLDDELKLVALQNLFQSDPARAAAYVAEMLKSDSKASRELKETAVSLLGRQSGPEIAGMLLDIARTQPDPGLRGVAVLRLGQTGDDRLLDELMKIYEAERDREVKGQVLRSFTQAVSPRAYAKLLEVARADADPELRQAAIRGLARRDEGQALEDLPRLLPGERDEEVRAAILRALAQMNDPRARGALAEVARTAAAADTRAGAMRALARFDDAESVGVLVKLYDAERDEEIKSSLLRAFGRSKQESALLKLIEVARADASQEMRRQAVLLLGQSRDPRALKFLQELLR